MPSESDKPRKPPSRRGRVRKQFWLDPKTLSEAQTLLGTETESETVEIALGLVTFRHEMETGLASLDGRELDRRD
jgi:hypothetical protein